MYTSLITISALVATSFAASIPLTTRQNPCFITGNTVLPKEVADVSAALASKITCSANVRTLSNVPDVSAASGLSFSSIDFSKSSLSPLAFALDTFATSSSLADEDLALFEDRLNVYTATEAGIRSVAGNFNVIKVPKFFLSFQVSRIKSAQGVLGNAPGVQVEHLLGKVLKNAPRESAALLNQVRALATQLQ